MQGIIFNNVLGKRIPALDQIRKGLNLYGVRELLENNPSIFRSLFCYDATNLNAESILHRVEFVSDAVEKNKKTHTYFMNFIKCASQSILERFCIFCTGSKSLPLSAKLTVNIEGDKGFYASTCSFTIDIPIGYSCQRDFSESFNAVLNEEKSAFSVV